MAVPGLGHGVSDKLPVRTTNTSTKLQLSYAVSRLLLDQSFYTINENLLLMS